MAVGCRDTAASGRCWACDVSKAVRFTVRSCLQRHYPLVRASEEPNGEGAGDDMSGYGLGGKGSFFGFGRFQELQVGRLAMVGFAGKEPYVSDLDLPPPKK